MYRFSHPKELQVGDPPIVARAFAATIVRRTARAALLRVECALTASTVEVWMPSAEMRVTEPGTVRGPRWWMNSLREKCRDAAEGTT